MKHPDVQKRMHATMHLLPAAAAALVLAAAYALLKDLFFQSDAKSVFAILSDAFLLSGTLFAGVGGLSWIASKGVFDIFGYGCSLFFGHYLPFDSVSRRGEKFYDYKVGKEEKGRRWRADFLLVGAGGLVLSGLFLILYAL